MTSFGFEDPAWLLLLPLLAAARWWARRRPGLAPRSAALLVAAVAGTETAFSWRAVAYRASRWLLGAGVLLAVLAQARPRRQFVERDEEAEGIDIVLVMDVSTSMLARDFEPDRLEASKYVAQQFIADRPFDQIGLVAFAGEAFTQSALTLDHQVLQTMTGGLEAGSLADGTAIGMGLAAAVNRLKDSESPSRVVILLTDGVNMGGYIDPRTAAQLADRYGVRVYTVGVGSNGTALSPIQGPGGRIQLVQVRVRIDEDLLREIAAETGGRYFRATDNASLAAIYDEIDELEKRPVQVSTTRRYADLYRWPLGLALAAVLAAGVIRVWLAPRVV